MTETPSPETRARRTRVALVFGGRSGEHPISAATAAGVMRAIDSDKYDVLPIGITRDGDWVLASGDPAQWELASGRLPEVTTGSGPALASLTEAGPVDVVFPLLHGPYGEDGTIQGLLELAGMALSGAGGTATAGAASPCWRLPRLRSVPRGASSGDARGMRADDGGAA